MLRCTSDKFFKETKHFQESVEDKQDKLLAAIIEYHNKVYQNNLKESMKIGKYNDDCSRDSGKGRIKKRRNSQ